MRYRVLAQSIVLAMLRLAPSGCASTDPVTTPPALPVSAASVATQSGEAVPGALHVSAEQSQPGRDPGASVASPFTWPTTVTETVPASLHTAAPPPAPDPLAVERRSVEALDRIAGFIPIKEEPGGRVVTLSTDELFAPGDWHFAPNTALRLEDLAAALRLQGDKQIDIDGFTDSLGSAQENEYLSLKRATAIRDFLVAHDVDGSKMRVEGLGSRRPLADNSDAFGRAENRRVEIRIRSLREQHAERKPKPARALQGGA